MVPELAAVLGQPSLAEAATQALWAIFMRSKMPEVGLAGVTCQVTCGIRGGGAEWRVKCGMH